jgi:hypothetical protein
MDIFNVLSLGVLDRFASMILDKAEPGKGRGISLINLQDAIKWVLGAHVTSEDSAKLLSAASDVLPVMLESLEVAFNGNFSVYSFMLSVISVDKSLHHADSIFFSSFGFFY